MTDSALSSQNQLSEDTTPLWFLDVDGVINAFPNHSTDNALHYKTFKASPNRWRGMSEEDKMDAYSLPNGLHRYKITYDPTIIERIKNLHTAGMVRVVWLTTWGKGANGELGQGLGLPRLASAGEPIYRQAQVYGNVALSHTNDLGVWWKLAAIREYLLRHPKASKFVWTDDHLAFETSAVEWAAEVGGHCVASNERTGLTHDDLDKIEEYLMS